MTTRDTLERLAKEIEQMADDLERMGVQAADKRNFSFAAYKQAQAEAHRMCAAIVRTATVERKE